jgi:hypothetical protein
VVRFCHACGYPREFHDKVDGVGVRFCVLEDREGELLYGADRDQMAKRSFAEQTLREDRDTLEERVAAIQERMAKRRKARAKKRVRPNPRRAFA